MSSFLSNRKYDELKNKLFYTFILLVIYRISAHVPVSGVNGNALKQFFETGSGGLFDLMNTFSGGSFKRFSLLALGIMPYVTSSIIFSLIGEVFPKIAELQEDSEGHKKIQKWTRYAAVGLSLVQGYGMAVMFESFKTSSGIPVVNDPGFLFRLVTMISLAGGTMFLLWLGERITEYGLENGVSLIIYTGIVVDAPADLYSKITLFRNGEMSGLSFLGFGLIVICSFYLVAFVEKSFRNIPVQYAKRVVNNRVFGGVQNLPIKVDTAGIMPPILASSLLSAPLTLSNFIPANSQFKPFLDTLMASLRPGALLFEVLFAFLIIYMTYFYAPIQFKTKRVSDSLQKNNAFVPGIRPGQKTKEYLDAVLNNLCFFGWIFLVLICISPSLMQHGQSRVSGTALLIIVSVSIRTIMNIQAFIYADMYENAFKSSKGKHSANSRRF